MATFTDYDDVFADDVDGERGLALEEDEWLRNREARVKEGYVDGLAEGQNLFLQRGFNDGFREAAHLAAEIARIKGSVCAVLSFSLSRNGTVLSPAAEKDFQELLTHISQVQSQNLSHGGKAANHQHQDSVMVNIVSLSKRLGLGDTYSDHKSKDIPGKITDGVNAAGSKNSVTDESQGADGMQKFQGHEPVDHTNSKLSLPEGRNARETTPVRQTSCDVQSDSLMCIRQWFENLITLHQMPQLI